MDRFPRSDSIVQPPGWLANLYGASLWLDDRWLVADRICCTGMRLIPRP